VTLAKLPSWARRLLDEERVAHLALLDGDDRPRVLPVTFAVADGAIWSAIDEKPKRAPEPARVRWLRRRPGAALCVDAYSDDWDRLAWVQILGRVDVIVASEGAVGLDALVARYRQYRERRPPGPLLRLEPERALQWRASERRD
jgi:PPOX class probable F420-dependent enzyme